MKKLTSLLFVGLATLTCNTGCVALLSAGAVGTSAIVASDSRTTGTMIDDESIELKSLNILSNNREIYNASKLEATSVNGRVLVTGQCRDKEYLSYINDRISKLPQVKEVINKVENIEPVSMGQRTEDSWITTKVKTQLLFGKEINSGRFKVITENSIVYLIGVVTQSEANRAINVTRQISGVKKVVKVFDYITEDSKVSQIFKDDGSAASSNTGSNAEVSSAGSNTSENAPIYYEETTTIEQPTTIQQSVVNTTPVNNTSNSTIVADPIGNTTVAPAGTSDTSADDSFIIE